MVQPEVLASGNLLVHQYGAIDRARVHSVLQNNLDDIVAIRNALTAIL